MNTKCDSCEVETDGTPEAMAEHKMTAHPEATEETAAPEATTDEAAA